MHGIGTGMGSLLLLTAVSGMGSLLLLPAGTQGNSYCRQVRTVQLLLLTWAVLVHHARLWAARYSYCRHYRGLHCTPT